MILQKMPVLRYTFVNNPTSRSAPPPHHPRHTLHPLPPLLRGRPLQVRRRCSPCHNAPPACSLSCHNTPPPTTTPSSQSYPLPPPHLRRCRPLQLQVCHRLRCYSSLTAKLPPPTTSPSPPTGFTYGGDMLGYCLSFPCRLPDSNFLSSKSARLGQTI